MAQTTVQLYTMPENEKVKDEISTQAPDIAETLQSVERHLGRELREGVYNADRGIREHYIVSLNGCPVDRRGPRRSNVLGDDVLFIHPAVAGG